MKYREKLEKCNVEKKRKMQRIKRCNDNVEKINKHFLIEID